MGENAALETPLDRRDDSGGDKRDTDRNQDTLAATKERFAHLSAGAHGFISVGRWSRTACRDDGVGSAHLAVEHAGLGFSPCCNRHNTPLFIAAAFCGAMRT